MGDLKMCQLENLKMRKFCLGNEKISKFDAVMLKIYNKLFKDIEKSNFIVKASIKNLALFIQNQYIC